MLITDPDNLNQGTEVTINTSTKLITLSLSGNLSTDGVTLKCLYSFLKEEWKQDATLIKFPFPMTPITDEQFELVNTWNFQTGTTPTLIRTGGWALKDTNGVSQEEWAGIVSLGTLGSSDQVYYQQWSGGSATNIVLSGATNQAVKVYGDASHGNFDYRSYFKLFVREYAKTYGFSQLSDIGVTTMTYQVYRFPLTNTTDLKIAATDTVVDTTAPYTGMSITWFASPQTRTGFVGGSGNFHAIVSGNSGTAEQIYTFVQRQLRKNTDIDSGAGTKTGKTTSSLLAFVGDSLGTLLYTTGEGTYIDNYSTSDTNRLSFTDDANAVRTFPYVAVLTIQFGDNLVNDTNAKYYVFFTNDDAGSNLGYDYGTSNAILVNTNERFTSVERSLSSNVARVGVSSAHGLTPGDGVSISGLTNPLYNGNYIITTVPATTAFTYSLVASNSGNTADTSGIVKPNMLADVSGSTSVQHTFDYDGNLQRGTGSSGVDAPITVVALGLSTGQFVKATGTIARSTSNTISLVAPLERNYLNP